MRPDNSPTAAWIVSGLVLSTCEIASRSAKRSQMGLGGAGSLRARTDGRCAGGRAHRLGCPAQRHRQGVDRCAVWGSACAGQRQQTPRGARGLGGIGSVGRLVATSHRIAADGYPETTDIDYRMLVGYGATADRHEDWRTNPQPLRDSPGHPSANEAHLKTYPARPTDRDKPSGYLVTGQVPGGSGAHTATDVPLSAFGPGAYSFTGVIDNTDVFFKLGQLALGGVVWPPGLSADPAKSQPPRPAVPPVPPVSAASPHNASASKKSP